MKPRAYKRRGEWWVACKHGNRTGPYATSRLAATAADSIAREPTVLCTAPRPRTTTTGGTER